MASNITVDTLTKGSTTLNTDEIVDTNSNQICKAWVNFNGEGTVAIRDSYNVSSITDNGTGKYTINFTTAMADANYTYSGTAGNLGTTTTGRDITNNNSLTTTSASIHVTHTTTTSSDNPYIGVMFFGN